MEKLTYTHNADAAAVIAQAYDTPPLAYVRSYGCQQNVNDGEKIRGVLMDIGFGSYEELLDRCEVASASAARLKADLRDTGAKIDELALKMKHVAAYRQLKPIYDRYKASRDKEKFLRGHESEIILFEAAARECKRLGAVPLPATERMQAEIDELNARKAILKAELQKAQRKEQDYAAMRQNVEDFLSPPQPEQERKKNVELE